MAEQEHEQKREHEHKHEQAKFLYNRRYVGSRETVAYLLNDVSNTFNISGFNNRFIWDVVKIDFDIMAVLGIITGAWDVINDSIIGVMVDKTRTRFGKFRPYLLGFQIPLSLIGILYWFMPIFFPGTTTTYFPKILFYFIFNILKETGETFTGIAKAGYMSTITPNPEERGRLILLAELFSGYMGEDLPSILTGVFIDLVNNKVVQWKLSSVFLGMGGITAIVSCVFTLYFVIITRERVMQSVEKPSLKSGIKAVINNVPILMIMLSNFLGGFSVGANQTDYFIDVLGAASLQTAVNLPSSFNGTISYSFVMPLKRRFSSKFLWITADLYGRALWIIVFIIGSVNKNFKKRLLMCIVFGTQAWFDKWAFGVNKVINVDLYNEAMDYCEWKNGYRVEATTQVAIGLIKKIQDILMNSFKNMIYKRIGYEQGRVIGTQTDRTKWWVFALCTGMPTLTGALAVVPKFFYPITKEMRTRMYNELFERRRLTASNVNEADEIVDDFLNSDNY